MSYHINVPLTISSSLTFSLVLTSTYAIDLAWLLELSNECVSTHSKELSRLGHIVFTRSHSCFNEYSLYHELKSAKDVVIIVYLCSKQSLGKFLKLRLKGFI